MGACLAITTHNYADNKHPLSEYRGAISAKVVPPLSVCVSGGTYQWFSRCVAFRVPPTSTLGLRSRHPHAACPDHLTTILQGTLTMTTAVLHSRDDDGRLVVGVPLSNRPGERAWLYQTDYEALLAEYGTHSWYVNSNGSGGLYVRMKSRDRQNNVMVARLVMADPLARRIRYRDGDTLNLRARNLEVCRPESILAMRGHPLRTLKAA